ncbi:tRNA dihydrouridine synthase [Planctomicrobium sp. SH664]|uniref:tRNA dihydrouridine synthase n=1 Tax=Planctomicrobium sp. SH664 TaxID=3448125 RepID=UPI003F5B4167
MTTVVPPALAEEPLTIGNRRMPSRYFLAPLAGYTQLAFRRAIRQLGGLGLATTDLVQATLLRAQRPKSLELIATSPDDTPLSIQIFSGIKADLIAAAQWLEDQGFAGIDLNMGCPMAKVNGSGGGARLMCDTGGACSIVEDLVRAVSIPVTVKMRLGWDSQNITAPALAREFEQLGVAAITIHGRTRQQGFHGRVSLDGIGQVVAAVSQIPIIGNGDVRTPADALHMRQSTGCQAVALGRGALLDPWIFARLQSLTLGRPETAPAFAEKVQFLEDHFRFMFEQHGEYSCFLFRKFAAWYGQTLGIPDDLEHRLRTFASATEFAEITSEIRARPGERIATQATALIRVPNGPNELW